MIPEPEGQKLSHRCIHWDWAPQQFILICCGFAKKSFLDEGMRTTDICGYEDKYLECMDSADLAKWQLQVLLQDP